MSPVMLGTMASGVGSQVVNLLTANQATGGDTLSDTTGFAANTTGVTLSYSTAQQYEGAGSIAAACDGSVSEQGTKITIPAGTFAAGYSYTLRMAIRTTVGGVSYTYACINDWRGSVFADTQAYSADTWHVVSNTFASVTANEAGQATTLKFYKFSAATCTIWVDDLLAAEV